MRRLGRRAKAFCRQNRVLSCDEKLGLLGRQDDCNPEPDLPALDVHRRVVHLSGRDANERSQ